MNTKKSKSARIGHGLYLGLIVLFLYLPIGTYSMEETVPVGYIGEENLSFQLTGEHGVSRSSTMTLGSFRDGPRTRLKCVAVWTARTGCMIASRTSVEISEPENPGVSSPSFL